MKKHDELIDEEMPPELESRILRHAAPALLARRHQAERRRAITWWSSLFAGAVTAVAAFVLLRKSPTRATPSSIALNEDFLDHLEMFRHMDELRHEDLLKEVIEARA